MKVIAHRGACTEALENSWEAFEKAIDAGSFRIELDVHLTRDGQLIVIHDESFARTANSSQELTYLTRSEIEQSVRLKNGEKVPFLDEVLDRYLSRIEFNVEIKSEGLATVEAVGSICRKSSHPDRIIISSFNQETCQWLSKKFPELKIALLWDKSLWWPGSFAWGPVRFMRKNGIRIFHPDARLVTPAMVKGIKSRGWSIYPYVGLRKEQNPTELWIYLKTCGVDGLCTNYPREMLLWLQEVDDDRNRFEHIKALENRIP